MNENERKFFLKRFFSFNVPANIVTGSNNASFDESDELPPIKSQADYNLDGKKSQEFNYRIEKKSEMAESKKKAGLQNINEHSDNLENSQLISKNDKKIDFGTISRRNKFKRSTDSSKQLIANSTTTLTCSTSDYDFQSKTQIQVTKPSMSDFNFQNTELLCDLTIPDFNFLSCNRINENVKRGNLQEQYSIELKPFKKKGVQIDSENSIINIERNEPLDIAPLLSLSLNAAGSKSLLDDLPNPGSTKANKNTFHNYPSIEFSPSIIASYKIKYRLV